MLMLTILDVSPPPPCPQLAIGCFCLVHALQVDFVNTEALLNGSWRDGCALLVMPGGADLPYCRELNGPGNTLIRGQ